MFFLAGPGSPKSIKIITVILTNIRRIRGPDMVGPPEPPDAEETGKGRIRGRVAAIFPGRRAGVNRIITGSPARGPGKTARSARARKMARDKFAIISPLRVGKIEVSPGAHRAADGGLSRYGRRIAVDRAGARAAGAPRGTGINGVGTIRRATSDDPGPRRRSAENPPTPRAKRVRVQPMRSGRNHGMSTFAMKMGGFNCIFGVKPRLHDIRSPPILEAKCCRVRRIHSFSRILLNSKFATKIN